MNQIVDSSPIDWIEDRYVLDILERAAVTKMLGEKEVTQQKELAVAQIEAVLEDELDSERRQSSTPEEDPATGDLRCPWENLDRLEVRRPRTIDAMVQEGWRCATTKEFGSAPSLTISPCRT